MKRSEAPAPAATLPAPPVAARKPLVREVHGERLVDDYAWLRDPNWREVMRDPKKLDPAIRAYLEAENRYTETILADLAELRRKLVAEMRGRIKEDDSTVPARDGPYAYYVRYREGGQHPILCREPVRGGVDRPILGGELARARADSAILGGEPAPPRGGPAQDRREQDQVPAGAEQVLLDGDELAKGHAYFQVGPARHSPNHRRLAWSADDRGSEYFSIRVRDLASGADLGDTVPDSTGGVVWTRDASAFFYVRLDAEHRPSRVYLHRLGTPAADDRLVYEEKDKGFFVGLAELQAGEFGAISTGDHETTEVHLLDLADPAAAPRLIAARTTGVRYDVEHHPAFPFIPSSLAGEAKAAYAGHRSRTRREAAAMAMSRAAEPRALVAPRGGHADSDHPPPARVTLASPSLHAGSLANARDLPHKGGGKESVGLRGKERQDGEPVLVIHTNADGAEDFKIMTAPLATPGREHWRELIPHRPGTLVLDIALYRDWLVRLEREDGLPRIVVRRLADGEEHEIAFAEEAYSLGMIAGFEFDTDNLRFSYSSMTTPAEVWDYDMKTRERVLRKRQEVPSGHDPADYVTRRIFAPAADGETVPISLLFRRETPIDGTAPCLLYGYGAYGHAIPAAFSTNRLSLVDRGFVYAIAHVRGGTEKGWRWYREGKLAHKENTFSDFIAAAEHLIRQRFTAKGRIVAHGGSAGGLLMGAVANMRPDLFAGILAEVPFVDALNTMLDDTLPLTPPEWPEWGNPIADAETFRRLRAYSPYDNVRAQDYPAMLVLAGLTDPRVTYWEPAKWVARLRALNTGARPLMLRTNLDAGHGGGAGRFERLEEVALGYVFALRAVGVV